MDWTRFDPLRYMHTGRTHLLLRKATVSSTTFSRTASLQKRPFLSPDFLRSSIQLGNLPVPTSRGSAKEPALTGLGFLIIVWCLLF